MTAVVLVVDDEPAMSTLIERQFRAKIKGGEYRFLFASDGHEAILKLRARPDVDIVVSDINMPNMDGLTLLERLRNIDPLLKTVIVSAYGDMDNIRTAMNRGAFDFVTKPVDFRDLELTLEKTLAEAASLRELRRRQATMEHDRACLTRYFSPNLVRRLLEDSDQMTLGVERRNLSFVFTDLAGFTPLVDRSEPKSILRLLNEYMHGMTEITFAHGGTVERIVGDALPAACAA